MITKFIWLIILYTLIFTNMNITANAQDIYVTKEGPSTLYVASEKINVLSDNSFEVWTKWTLPADEYTILKNTGKKGNWDEYFYDPHKQTYDLWEKNTFMIDLTTNVWYYSPWDSKKFYAVPADSKLSMIISACMKSLTNNNDPLNITGHYDGTDQGTLDIRYTADNRYLIDFFRFRIYGFDNVEATLKDNRLYFEDKAPNGKVLSTGYVEKINYNQVNVTIENSLNPHINGKNFIYVKD